MVTKYFYINAINLEEAKSDARRENKRTKNNFIKISTGRKDTIRAGCYKFDVI